MVGELVPYGFNKIQTFFRFRKLIAYSLKLLLQLQHLLTQVSIFLHQMGVVIIHFAPQVTILTGVQLRLFQLLLQQPYFSLMKAITAQLKTIPTFARHVVDRPVSAMLNVYDSLRC